MNLHLGKKEPIENKVFFYGLFAAVIGLSLLVVRDLLSIIILAALISSLFHPVYLWFKSKLNNKDMFAVPATLLTFLLSLVIPIIIVIFMSAGQINIFLADLSEFAGNSQEIQEILNYDKNIEAGIDTESVTTSVKKVIDDVNNFTASIPFINESELTITEVRNSIGDLTKTFAQSFGDTILSIASNIPAFITNLIVFIIVLATLIPNQQKIRQYIMRLSPLENDLDRIYLKKVSSMSKAMVEGTFTVATILGAVWALLFFIAGVPYVLFWTVLSMILSIIPNGGALVNWPLVIILLLSGNIFGGLFLLIGNLVLVSFLDGYLRSQMTSKDAHLNPAITLVGIVGGFQLFGILGFIYGPVVMILLVTTLDIYVNHYKGK